MPLQRVGPMLIKRHDNVMFTLLTTDPNKICCIRCTTIMANEHTVMESHDCDLERAKRAAERSAKQGK